MILFSSLFTVGFTGFLVGEIFDSAVVRILYFCIMLFGIIGGSLYENKQDDRIKRIEKEIEKMRGDNNAR